MTDRLWKKSDVVIVAVVGSLYAYTLFRHDSIYQDRYRSREDCVKDWGDDDARECNHHVHVGGGYWLGPRYEEGARPVTRAPLLRESRALVTRGGFGLTGARYARGGG